MKHEEIKIPIEDKYSCEELQVKLEKVLKKGFKCIIEKVKNESMSGAIVTNYYLKITKK